MPGGVKMLRGVFVRRLVAAAHMPANAADAQVHPPVTGLQTFFAALGARFDVLYLVEMSAVVQIILLLRAVRSTWQLRTAVSQEQYRTANNS